MRIVVFPSGWDAMGYHRLIWPAMLLAQQGHDVKIASPDDDTRIRVAVDSEGRIKDAATPDCDIAVFQRPTQPALVEVMRIWQNAGIRVVVDMDDDFRGERAYKEENPIFYKVLRERPDETWQAASDACQLADRVVVSTEALQEVYGGTVVQNCVPQWYLDIDPEQFKEADMFGWTGALAWRQLDPGIVGNSFQRLIDHGWRFGIVGNGEGAREAFGLKEDPPATGPLHQALYPKWLARFAVCAIPLAPTTFNRSKSWLTMLTCAAVGVVPVVSPIGEYPKLLGMGVGDAAQTTPTWYTRINRLLRYEDVRAKMVERGREVAAEYTLEKNCGKWLDAWNSATLQLVVIGKQVPTPAKGNSHDPQD